MALTNTERQHKFLERQKKRGLLKRVVWVHLADWPRVQRYVAKINNQRDKANRTPEGPDSTKTNGE